MRTDMVMQEVETTYEKVKSLAGWSVDKRVVLTVTSYYVTSEREFDAACFNRAIGALKERSGLFSPMRGNLLPMMAAFLTEADTTIDEAADRLFAKQKVLRSSGFRNTIHSYLAALLMSEDPELYEMEAKQAKSLYDAMKKQQFLLTSDDDYAYAMLLGKKGEDPAYHAEQMKAYYDAFRKEKFRSGNELQWLSQVMTYMETDYDPNKVSQVVRLLDTLKRETKAKPVHYPMIGFLTVFGIADDKIQSILQLAHQFETMKLFRGSKEMAFTLAAGYVMHQLTDRAEEMNFSLAASVEMIMQAQQAVMAATVAAVAASSAAASSGNS